MIYPEHCVKLHATPSDWRNTQMNVLRQTPPQTCRLLRLPQVLELLPVSKSHWWQGVKDGRYPAPVKLSERITCWRESDIHALLESLEG
jgi:prophage regulatory protein